MGAIGATEAIGAKGQVAARLRRRIREQGPISFAEFMSEALYGKGGYYRSKSLPIGPQGDFVTGSSLSPLFGRATAALLRRLDQFHPDGRADFLEAGYGNGAHIRSVSEALQPIESRRLLAWDQVPRALPKSAISVEGIEDVAANSITGLIFSYELFDALPVHRLVQRSDGVIGELMVDLGQGGAFEWLEADRTKSELVELISSECEDLEVGQIVDLSSGWRPLYRDLASRLRRGLIVTCDYGFEARQLLDARVRKNGTLACYRSQRVHRDPFIEVGEQDLTAHVDFSALRDEGERAGLETVSLTRQARWLTACGLFDELQGADPETVLEAGTLLNGEGMGEEIRVLIQARDVDPAELFDLELLG